MSVQKKWLVAATGLVALSVTVVYAGAPNAMAAPRPAFEPNVYAEFGVGYAQTDYSDFYDSSNWTNTSNQDGGFAYSGDFGYAFMPHLAVELGGGYLPKATYDDSNDESNYYKSWYGYVAGRLDTMVKDKIGVFAKAGGVYRSMKDWNKATNTGLNDYYWGAMFGAGLIYDLKHDFYATAEYNYLSGTSDSNEGETYPDANIFLAKLGYRFSF